MTQTPVSFAAVHARSSPMNATTPACYVEHGPALMYTAASGRRRRGRQRMNFGLHLIQQNLDVDELRRLWRWADTAGFDWVDVSDHFYEAPPVDGSGSYFEATTCM